jgi:hypothetical protein
MTRTKIALAALLFAATSSTAFAQGYDPNLANRNQGLIQPYTYGYSASGALGNVQPPAPALQSAPVRMHRQRQGSPVRTGR